jgi:hypothetical protein
VTSKNFDVLSPTVRPTFTLGGQQFTAKAKLPFRKWQALIDAAGNDEMTDKQQTDEFFKLALIPADRQRFFMMLDWDGGDGDEADEQLVVDQRQANELTKWLMEIYTGKLPNSSESSSDGSAPTATSQNVVSLSSRSQAG